MTVKPRSTSTRTEKATKARRVTRAQRMAIEVADMLELLPGFVLDELGRVLIEEIDRRTKDGAV